MFENYEFLSKTKTLGYIRTIFQLLYLIRIIVVHLDSGINFELHLYDHS